MIKFQSEIQGVYILPSREFLSTDVWGFHTSVSYIKYEFDDRFFVFIPDAGGYFTNFSVF